MCVCGAVVWRGWGEGCVVLLRLIPHLTLLSRYAKRAREMWRRRKKVWLLENDLHWLDPQFANYYEMSANVSSRRIHQLGFSQQFFFVVALMTWGFLICVYGFFIQLMAFAQASGTTRYAAWYDPASPSIACFTLGACVLITNIAKR